MLLGDLVSGKESSSCVIIQDSLETSAKSLLLSFVKSLLERVDFVCVISFDIPPSKFVNAFESDVRSRLLPIDAYSDYMKWDLSRENKSDSSCIYYDSNIPAITKQAIKRRCSLIKSDSPVKVAIVIDSLSKLVHHSVSKTCQVLHQLSHGDQENNGYQVEQVLCIIHSDLHDNHILHSLGSIASSVLEIVPCTQSTELDSETVDKSDNVESYCKMLHIRKTGKVLKKKQKYIVNNRFELTEFVEEEWISKPNFQPVVEEEKPNKVDPLSDLTFNLKLTKQEEQARASTHLPYMHHTQGPQVTIHNKQESQIFYQPDDADDFDEDDPDDDLDI